MVERVPHDLDAERALIGSMLLTRTAIAQAVKVSREDDFFDPRLATLFRVITTMWRSGRPIDTVTLAATLDAAGELAAVGGRAGLMTLSAETPASANAPHYANLIAGHAAKRRLLAVADDLRELAFDTLLDAADAVARARELVVKAEMPPMGGEASPTLAQLLEVTPEAPDWLVPDWLARCERLVFVAGEGIGKSMLIRQLAVMLASGIHPWGRWPIRPMRVLLFDLENPPDLVMRKMRPIYEAARRSNRRMSDELLRVELRPEGIDVTSRADALWLEERIAVNVPDIVCIGPLYKLHDSDESDFRAVRQVQSILDSIRTRYQLSFIMETHAPHEAFKGGVLRISGSRAWMRWPEFVISLRPVLEDKLNGDWLVEHARPPRDERTWPKLLKRHGHTWPWEALEEIPPPQTALEIV